MTPRWSLAVACLALASGCGPEPPGTTPPTGPRADLATAASGSLTGQRFFGRSSVEPAINDADGSTVFLLTPDMGPFPSKANGSAVAPMYLPMYPSSSTIDPAALNCQPTNCDHLSALPFSTPVYPGGAVIGHDHLIGVPPTGDFNVAWHVILVVFTPQAVADGAINHRVMTLQGVEALVAAGDADTVATPITFNCSIVSAVTYFNGTPATF